MTLRLVSVFFLMITPASLSAAQRLATETVTVKDARNRPVTDLRQEEFTLKVDGEVRPLESWERVVDFRQQVSYRLTAGVARGKPKRTHRVEVSVSRLNVRLEYLPAAVY